MNVKVIAVTNHSSLIELMDNEKIIRVIIPSSKIIGGEIEKDVLKQAIPYGYPWSEIKLQFDSEKFENEMHNVDVWTAEDAIKYPKKVWAAVNATIGGELSAILLTAKGEIQRSNQ